MPDSYDRENQLQEQLNIFLENKFGLPDADYYAQLDLVGFLRLKSILSGINNIFTLKVSLAFAEWLTNHLELDDEASTQIFSQIKGTKPNANGYDIEVSKHVKVIAEVKCNIPINNGRVYGSAQKNGIQKDIDALIYGKNKSPISPTDYLKFMVFLDLPEIRAATDHFVKNMKNDKERILFLTNKSKAVDTNRVHVVYVRF